MEPTTFAELGLSPKVLAAIEAAGYSSPTPIQASAIPVALTGRDVLGIAQTGTGKTAAFTMPMITRLETGRARARMPRSLILAPTRELAAQVAQSFEKYGVNHKLDVALLIGGVSMDDQVKKLDRGVDVLIATPGRLLDHFGRGRIMLMGVEILVIDEADRMLDMGFIPDIEKICKLLPPRRQTLFFSATMPAEITRLVNTFLKDPVRVEVAKPATTAKTITQRFRFCANGEDWAKREELRNLMRAEDVRNAIIFCNRKRDVAILLKSLLKHGFNAGALHGDMDQKSRMETLDKFRSGEINFLAASDVAARGLDIPDVSHVFNFDLPWQSDDYVHRIGRTGRAGKLGYSASLVTIDDLKLLQDIEKITGETAVWLGESPTEEDIAGAGKRKRGRGGRGGTASQSSAQARGRGGRDDRPEQRAAKPPRRDEPGADRQRRPAAEVPGLGEQPDVAPPDIQVLAGEAAGDGETGETRRRRRRGRGGRSEGEGRGEHIAVATSGDGEGAAESRERARHDRSSGRREAQGPSESREPREHREPREQREPTVQREQRPQRAASPQAQPRPSQPRPQRAAEQGERTQGAAHGFADNVPAFLRRPVPKRQKLSASD
ncbi:MAG: DEAD/DEAH box helicase [Hyphomicrobiaceae bacterium]|nr:DEAD/DEAH box helicase [Hyphomicrobiaceae bacterium]